MEGLLTVLAIFAGVCIVIEVLTGRHGKGGGGDDDDFIE